MRIVVRRKCYERRGAATIEFVLSLPLLILVLLGCIDAGRFALKYICLTSAASEGAAFASLNAPGKFGGTGNWVAAVQQRAITESTSFDPPLTPADITVDLSVLELGRVSVQAQCSFETLVIWPGLPHVWSMSRTVVMAQTP